MGRHQTKVAVALLLIILSFIHLSKFNEGDIDITSIDSVLSIGINNADIKFYHTHASAAPTDATTRKTSITKQTAGTITLSNICLRYKTAAIISAEPTNNTSSLVQYTNEEVELLSHQEMTNNNTIFNINEGILHIMHLNRRNYEIRTVPIYDEYSWSDIVQDAEWIITSSSNSNISDNGVLWMYNWDLSNNPGHCMNDFAFSAALDLIINDNDDDNSNRTTDIQQPYYTYFVHAEHMLLENECNNFCCKLFAERFGLIDYQMQIRPALENNSNTTTTNIITKPTLCFDQITFPKLEAVRHQYNDVTNRGIQMLRERSWMVMKNELDSTPWSASLSEPADDVNEAADSSNSNGTISPHPTSAPKILLFDRYDATSRHLVNASDIISKLQQSYNIQIYRVPATEWSNATLLHQAKLFNSYQYIISPHGAHLFNMIHVRPQTKILEIQCPVLNRRWGLHQQWFSMYGPAINVHWRTYTEMEGCKEDGQVLFNYTPKNITVDVDKVVTEAVEHCDLKPKAVNDGSATEYTLEYYDPYKQNCSFYNKYCYVCYMHLSFIRRD